MPTRKSNNAYYRSPDITGIINNLSTAMGLKGNADSNYLTNLNKMGRLEGITLDNTQKQNIARLIQEAVASTTDPVRRAGIGSIKSYGDSGLGQQYWERLPALVKKGKFERDQAGSEAGVAGILAGLAEQIKKHGMRPDIEDYETGPGKMFKGGTQYDEAIAGATSNFEELVRKYRAVGGKGDAQKTAAQQAGLVASDIGVDESQRQYNRARTRAVGKTNEAQIREIEGRISSLRGLTRLRKKEITNRILDNIARLDQDILDSKKGRELLDKKVKYWVEQELTAKERTATQGLIKEQEQMQKDELSTTLSYKRERLKQLKRKATSLAETAASDASVADQLNTLRVEIAELDRDIRTEQKGKAELQKDTAEAKKGRAITLAEMSTMEKNALKPEILAKATKIEAQIRETEQKIELAKARTDDVNQARNVKILKSRNMNNKNALQQLLSPHLQKYHEQRAANEANKFAQQTALKMIPTPKAKKPPEPKGGIDNWDLLTGIGIGREDVEPMPGEEYDTLYSDIMELIEDGRLTRKSLDTKDAQGKKPRTGIIKAMIQKLGVNKTDATQVLEQWLEELLPAPAEG